MIPVVCSVNIEPDLINEFLTTTYASDTDAPEDLCVITTRDWSPYRDEARLGPEEARRQGRVAIPRGGGPMKTPSRPPWTTQFKTAFENQSPLDIAQALRDVETVPQDMSKEFCVIMDGQTAEEKSVLLVKTSRGPESNLLRDNESPIVQYRSSFEEANSIIQGVCIGEGSLEELLWNQQIRC